MWRRAVIAKSFEEVQTKVADIIKDRVLIGHAIHNDLKVRPPSYLATPVILLTENVFVLVWHQALLLSHPRPLIRDTQHLAHKNGQSRGSRPALRNLVRDMFAVPIQGGEHSSVRVVLPSSPFAISNMNEVKLTIMCVG